MKRKKKNAEYVVGFILFLLINVSVFSFQYWLMGIHFQVCLLFLAIGVVVDSYILNKILDLRVKHKFRYRRIYSTRKIFLLLDWLLTKMYPESRIRRRVVIAFAADTWTMLTAGLPANLSKLILAYAFAYLLQIPDLTPWGGIRFMAVAVVSIIFGARIMFLVIDVFTKKLLTLFRGNL